MGLSLWNIKKWWKMLRHKSLLHVNQGVGKCYSFESIQGYYNDLTEKVTKDTAHYDSVEVITVADGHGKQILFPIAIFQYGLGAYDLFLQGVDEELMKKKFLCQLEWAYDNQKEDGSWDNFGYSLPDAPYSAMAQGEGASLLIRGYELTKDEKYLKAAKKAIDFMLLPKENGGTAEINEDSIYLYEFTCYPVVFNGWIFAIFGLVDYLIISKDQAYGEILSKTLDTLVRELPRMDNGYWSMYRKDNTIASPFYHDLHIAQLKVLYDYTGNEAFEELCTRFEAYKKKRRYRRKAFYVKAWQKLTRK